jgi:hypothetical protein
LLKSPDATQSLGPDGCFTVAEGQAAPNNSHIDFCGHRWDFTQTIADIAPEEWSGSPFHLE